MTEKPEDVFTPATPVRDDMFATRRHERLQERVQGALQEQGKQVIAYGPTGVGKTSLIRYLCRNGNIKYVRVERQGEKGPIRMKGPDAECGFPDPRRSRMNCTEDP